MGVGVDRVLQQLLAQSCQARAFDEKSCVAGLLYSADLIQYDVSNLCLLRPIVSLDLTAYCRVRYGCSLLCGSVGCQLFFCRLCFSCRLF